MKIIQIAQTAIGLTGLGDDGEIYTWNTAGNDWKPVKQ
jgi:hypothetical protein